MANITLNGASSVDAFAVVPSAPYPITDYQPILDATSGHGFISGYDIYVIGGDAQGEPVFDVVNYDVLFSDDPRRQGVPGLDPSTTYADAVYHNGVSLGLSPLQPYVIPFSVFESENLPVIDLSGDDRIENDSATPALLAGQGGNDTLVAGSGGDTLDGGPGVDSMVGGAGNDTFYVDNPKDVVVSGPGQGEDTVYVSGPWKLAPDAHIAHVILTGAGNLAFTANAFTTSILGNGGVNTLDDGGHAVSLAGGAGSDVYVVGNAGTQVTEAPGGGYDTVRTTLHSYTLPDNVEALTYTGPVDYAGSDPFTNFRGTGNAATNLIVGSAGDDQLDDGGGGSDRLVGGGGNDTYVVHSPTDTIVETANGGGDVILTDASAIRVAANVEGVEYIGSGPTFTAYANATGVAFAGGAENDRFIGGAGEDAFGSAGSYFQPNFVTGNDTFTGGAGADTFLFDDSVTGVERITDFQVGVDHLLNTFLSGGEYFFGYHLTGEPLNQLSASTLAGLSPTTAYTEDEYDRSTGTLYADDVHIDFSTGFYTLTHNHIVATFDNHPALTLADL